MEQVNIYTYTKINLKKKTGVIGYILEKQTEKGPATLSKLEIVSDMTNNRAELTVLLKALSRLNKPCRLAIYTESNYVASAYIMRRIDRWKQNGWLNAKDRVVANCKEWSMLDDCLKKHAFYFCVRQEHEYRDWLRAEVDRKIKEMDRNV